MLIIGCIKVLPAIIMNIYRYAQLFTLVYQTYQIMTIVYVERD